MRINLNGLDFNTGVPDVNGAEWMITEMDGWDAPALRQSFGEATSRHGTVLQESMLGSRSIVLRGICKAQGEAGFWTAYNGLLGLTNNFFVPKFLTVYEPTVKRLGVIRGGVPRLEFNGVGAFTFEIPLLATDPLKYNVTTETLTIPSLTTVNFTMDGTFPTAPTFVSSGVMDVRDGPGARVSTSPNAMAAGTVLDFAKRTIFSGATNRYSTITPTSTWWSLQPGAMTVRNDGSASTTMTYNPAWI